MYLIKPFLFLMVFVFVSPQAFSLVEVNPPPGGISLQIEEADIVNGNDISATADFCLYSDATGPAPENETAAFRIKWDSDNGAGTVQNLEAPDFSIPYTISVAVGAGQTSGFTDLTEGLYSSNDTPLYLGTVPTDPCSINDNPNMTIKMTIPGSSLASARSGAYGGANTLTLTVEEPT